MPDRTAARVLAASLLAGLAACGGNVKSGSAEPPSEFGRLQKTLLGCPSMQGVYLWPPEAGAYAKGFATNVRPWEGALPVSVGKRPMQIWVTDKSRHIRFNSREINLDPQRRSSMAHEWSYAEYSLGTCSSNMVEFEPEPVDSGASERGGSVQKRGFRLARLQDGALAVGIKTVTTGQRGSIFRWGDVSAGSIPLPDAVSWQWSKLRRIAPGDREPPAMDAAQPEGSAR